MQSLTLYQGSKTIWASIEADGDLRVSSEDGETEVIAAISAKRKGELLDLLRGEFGPLGADDPVPGHSPEEAQDALLVAYVGKKWSNRPGAVQGFHDFAAARGLEPAWFRWP